MLSWKQAIKDFEIYLRLEKSLSENSIEAYCDDVYKLEKFFSEKQSSIGPLTITYQDLREFVAWFGAGNNNARTQSRIISGIRAFYKFLLIEGEIGENPATLPTESKDLLCAIKLTAALAQCSPQPYSSPPRRSKPSA